MFRVIISLFISSVCFQFVAQTTVSGGIYQNTTWSASGSPYLMTGSMVVFPGVTLTIEPGVEVRVTPDYSFNTGNLRYLEVRGTLVAVGTVSNCQFIDNDFGFAEAYGHTIQNCYFEGNGVAIDNSGGANISNNTFDSNVLAVRLGDGSSLTNNIITNNGVGVAVLAYSPNSTLIENNTICYNTDYNLQNLTDKNFQVNANCFCSQDSTYIENLILDGYDDITKGLVNYAIYDDSCANVLDYVVKINLDGGAGLATLQPNSWRLKCQDANTLYIESAQVFQLELINSIGQVQKEIMLQKGENKISTNHFPSGLYFLKNEFGSTQKVLL